MADISAQRLPACCNDHSQSCKLLVAQHYVVLDEALMLMSLSYKHILGSGNEVVAE